MSGDLRYRVVRGGSFDKCLTKLRLSGRRRGARRHHLAATTAPRTAATSRGLEFSPSPPWDWRTTACVAKESPGDAGFWPRARVGGFRVSHA
jgi:hypothetical protein